jgi:lysophospholipase L1-like esterase
MRPRRTRRLGAWLATLLLASTSVGLVVGLAELYVRHSDTRIASAEGDLAGNPFSLVRYTPAGRRLVPGANVVIRNHYLSRRDVPMRINRHGFRDRELVVPKPEGEVRILVLGDSITWGDYLPAEEVYVERLEARLRAQGVDRVEVVNAGVGDMGLRGEVDLLLDRGLVVEPDVVVVGFYLNDSRPPWGFPAERGGRGWLRRHSMLANRIYDWALLRRWLQERGEGRLGWVTAASRLDWQHDPDQFLELARLAHYDWGAAWQPESWVEVDAQLSRLEQLGDTHHFRVVLVALPVAFQVQASFVEDTPQRELAGLAKSRGFEFVDLLPALRKHSDERLFFDHCHPTPRGNDLIAQALESYLAPTLQRRAAPQ